MRKLFTALFLATVAAALLGAALPATARAESLPAYEPQTTCSYWPALAPRIFVHPPLMSPLGNLGINNGLVVNPWQTMGYRATIYRWSGTKWARYDGTQLMTIEANDTVDTTGQYWWNTATKRWDYPIEFQIRHNGQYAVWFELYWSANQYFGSASYSGWVQAIEGSEDNICDFFEF